MRSFLISIALLVLAPCVYAEEVDLTCIPKNKLQSVDKASIYMSLDDKTNAISWRYDYLDFEVSFEPTFWSEQLIVFHFEPRFPGYPIVSVFNTAFGSLDRTSGALQLAWLNDSSWYMEEVRLELYSCDLTSGKKPKF